jgi:hypothetical protein
MMAMAFPAAAGYRRRKPPKTLELTRPRNVMMTPVVTAFLALLGKDTRTHPGRIGGLPKRLIARATRLTKGVKVTDDDRRPDDVSF